MRACVRFRRFGCGAFRRGRARESRERNSDLAAHSGGVEALNAASAALAAAGIADGGVSELRALFESAQKAGFADNLAVDFSVMNSFGYYTGLVFSVYADGVSAPLDRWAL